MTIHPLIPVTGSSQITAYAYNPGTQALTVAFTGGGTYVYAGVPAEVADAFATAESHGKAFGSLIRGKYDYNKLPAPEAVPAETPQP